MTSFAAFYASPVGCFFRNIVLSHLGPVRSHENILGVGPIVPIIDKIKCQERVVLVPEIFEGSVERNSKKYPVISFNEKSALPLKKETFDRIIMIHTLEHVTYPASFLREIWRALKPGGTLALYLPNQVRPFDNALHLLESKLYTTPECDEILNESFFQVSSRRACFFLPTQWIQYMPRMCRVLEKCLGALPIAYGSRITLIQARKDIELKIQESPPLTWQRA